jgi:DNA-binding CsgD family transcriptional regulator
VAVPHQLWARVVWAALDTAAIGGLPLDELCTGLPFDAMSVRKLKRVDWTDYCTICERMGELTGGTLDDLLEGAYHQAIPELRRFAGAVVGPMALSRFLFEILDPIMFPPIEFRYEELGPDRFRITSQLRQGARPCEAWFFGGLGALRGMPRSLGLPPAQILSAKYGPDMSDIEARMPESRTLAHRALKVAGRAMRLVIGAEDDGTPVDMLLGPARPTDAVEVRLELATPAWKLTPRQTDVLRLVARGDSNKDIAAALGCAENTIELHVTALLRRAGVSSRTQLVARFWTETWT